MGRHGHTATIRESGYRRKPRSHDPPREKGKDCACSPSIVAAVLVARPSSPSPSPTPSAPPQIARVVTSDRGREAVSRTARTTYVVTEERDRAATATAPSPMPSKTCPASTSIATAPSEPQQPSAIRGSSTQQVLVLLDGLPVAGAQIDGVDLEQYAAAGVDAHRSRRRRRLDALRLGFDRRRDQHHYGAAAGASGGDRRHRLVRRANLSRFRRRIVSFSRTYAANDYPVARRAHQQNAQAGLRRTASLRAHRIGAFDLRSAATSATRRRRARRTRLLSRRRASRANVNRDVRLNAEHRGARSTTSLTLRRLLARSFVYCDTPVDANCPNSYVPDARRRARRQIRRSRRCSTIGAGWRACATSSATQRERARLRRRSLARHRPHRSGHRRRFAAMRPTTLRSSTRTRKRPHTCSRSGLGRNGGADLRRAAGRTRRRHRRRVLAVAGRHRCRSRAALQLRAQRGDGLPRADRRGTLLSRFFQSEPRARAHARRRRDVRRAGDSGAAPRSAGSRPAGRTSSSRRRRPTFRRTSAARSSQGLTFAVQTPAAHGFSAALDVTNLYRAQDLDTGTRLPGRGPVFAATLALRYARAADEPVRRLWRSPFVRRARKSPAIRISHRHTPRTSRPRSRTWTPMRATASRRASSSCCAATISATIATRSTPDIRCPAAPSP